MESLFDFMSMFLFLCQGGNKHFDVHFRRIKLVHFLSKDGKDAFVKEEMDGEMFISRQRWNFSFIDNMIKVLFPICTLNWRVNIYVSCQGKGVNKKNESTTINI